MIDRLDPHLWQQALSQIQRELPSQAFETWFQPTRAVDSTSNSLTIEVPNAFFRDWLASHYSELIDRVLEGFVSSKVRVEYAIPSGKREVPGNLSEPTAAPAGPETGRAGPIASSTFLDAPANRPEKSQASARDSSPWPPSRPQGHPDVLLNPRYTFDQFVIGPSNRFAHAAAWAVCESPARAYNPLFIYGGVGLGKTHLMQAIGHHLLERFPESKGLYLSSERFTNQLITAIQNRTMASFRERFRSADFLLIDDIHFIGGKESTQEVFFHTFNALYDAHRQIMISSDRPPKELKGVEERLISRFEWGLVTDVQPPDLETRVAILRKKAEGQGQRVPDEVTLFIAERISSNIRELEGALNRVIAHAVLVGREISPSMAQEVLKDMVTETARRVTLDKIQQVVATHFRLSVADLRGKRRSREISLPRHIAMALARELTESTLPAIGEAFGGRDHATVLYACQKIAEAKQGNEGVRTLLQSLVASLKQNL